MPESDVSPLPPEYASVSWLLPLVLASTAVALVVISAAPVVPSLRARLSIRFSLRCLLLAALALAALIGWFVLAGIGTSQTNATIVAEVLAQRYDATLVNRGAIAERSVTNPLLANSVVEGAVLAAPPAFYPRTCEIYLRASPEDLLAVCNGSALPRTG